MSAQAHTATQLRVLSVFLTVDGETNAFHQGSWSVFVRLSGCRVGCTYCDTKYSWDPRNGALYTPETLLDYVLGTGGLCNKVTITGGEPMEQWGPALRGFVELLLERHYDISMETAGTEDLREITSLYPQINLIVDYKMPSAQQVKPTHLTSFRYLRSTDVVKFVCTLDEIALLPGIAHQLDGIGCRARMVFSPVWDAAAPLNSFINAARSVGLPALGVGLNLQLHKIVWPNDVRDEEG